jgi:hypothetical protein
VKRIAKTLVAVILAAAMLTACGAKTEDASADLGNNLTRAADVSEDETTPQAETTTAAETTAAETTTQAETTTTAPEAEKGLPIKIYSAVCNEPVQEVNSSPYKGVGYLTSEGKLFFFEGYSTEFKDASSASLVDTDVRDFINCRGTVYYVKNDNTLWAFGNNEDNRLGQKTLGKDSSGYETELDYIPSAEPVKVLDTDSVANVYIYNYRDWTGGYHESVCYLNFDKNVYEFERIRVANKIVAKNVAEFTTFPVEYYYYSYLTADGKVYKGNRNDNEDDSEIADGIVDIFYNPNELFYKKENGYYANIVGGSDIKSFVTADKIIKTDGSLWAKGKNDKGQLGDGTKVDKTSFVKIADNVMLAGNYWYTTSDGKTYIWSENDPTHKLLGGDENFTVTAYSQPFITWVRTSNDYWMRGRIVAPAYINPKEIYVHHGIIPCNGLDLMTSAETEYTG